MSFPLAFRRSRFIAALPPRCLAVALTLATVTTQACGGGGGDDGGTKPPVVAVASIDISPSPLSVTAGLTSQLTATPKSAAGATLSGREVTWSSADQTVASVSATSGLVTGVKVGSTTVTATSEGVHKDVAVSVTAAPVASIDVTPSPLGINVNQTSQLTATPKSSTGAALTDRAVSWSIADGTVATVSTTGLVTGMKVGTTTITATSESVHQDVVLNVALPPLASVVFSTQPAKTVAGVAIAPVQVQLLDGGGNVIPSNASVTITLTGGAAGASLAQPATANAVNGVATFSNLSIAKKGSAYHLVATAGGVQGTSGAFDISAAAATSIVKLAGDADTVVVGTVLPAPPSVQLKDAFGNTVDGITVTFAPASGSGSVAGGSVSTDANGVATVGSWTVGTAMGPNTLTASAGSLSATFNATVTGALTPGIQFVVGGLGSASSASVAVGQDIAVPLTLDLTNRGSADLAAIQLTINWDPALLTFKSESAGDWSGSVTTNPAGAGTGVYRIAGFSTSATLSSFVLRNLVFTGASGGSATITVTISAAGNASGTSILVATRPLAVTVTP